MDPKDQKIQQLESEVKRLTQALQIIGRKLEFLERENNRRRSEVNQIASAVQRIDR